MIAVKKEGAVLQQAGFEFEDDSVLNPAAIRDGHLIHLFYRAVHKGNYSSIGYCQLDAPLNVSMRLDTPLLSPEFDYEKHGMEDPRIVKIDDTFYLTYIAFDGSNALGAVATATTFLDFKRQGIIVPQISYADFDQLTRNNPALNKIYLDYNPGANILADKDLVFFPRRINGKLTFMHRIKPDIQITSVKTLEELTPDFWKDYFLHLADHIMLKPKYAHEINYVGGGCPPIETAHGWLVIYHGVKNGDTKGYEYSACAALFDLEDPRKEIARLPYPLFKPEEDYELKGDVDNVCFPTGTIIEGDTLYIYYGAADELIACASVSLSKLVEELVAISNV
jgi:predicted GH43/DUF377 family glycosyl hydrolase